MEPPRPHIKDWWEHQIRTYEQRYAAFCTRWHLDPEAVDSAVAFDDDHEPPDPFEFD